MRRFVVLLAITVTVPAWAHGFNPALLRIQELNQGRYQVLWKPPSGREGAPPPASVRPVFPERCKPAGLDTFDCGAPLAGESISVSGLADEQLDAVVEITDTAGHISSFVLRPRESLLIYPSAVTPPPSSSFFRLGIEHILTGYDHLLFVLGLVLLVGARWRLLGTITAFTIAHSLTLALTVFGVVRLAQPPVEACIALSILLLAVELAQTDRPTITGEYPWLVAFVFGLLHGFGFAAALSEAGLPPDRIPSSLLLFNLGVEAGQIAFVTIALASLALANRTGMRWVPRAATWIIGSCAAFWCIDRVIAFAS